METRLTTDQKIPGSTPGRLVSFLSVIGETEQEKKERDERKGLQKWLFSLVVKYLFRVQVAPVRFREEP